DRSEVVAEILSTARKQPTITGPCRLEPVAPAVHHPRARQHAQGRTEPDPVAGEFISEHGLAAAHRGHAGEVALAEPFPALGPCAGRPLREWHAAPATFRVDQLAQLEPLAAGLDSGMRRQDLLSQRGAGARQADDEHDAGPAVRIDRLDRLTPR